MNKKQIFALSFFVIQAVLCLVLFFVSAFAMALLGVTHTQANSPGGEFLQTLLEVVFASLLIFSLIGSVISIVGAIMAAKKRSGQAILNVLSLLVAGYLLVSGAVAFFTISQRGASNSDADSLMLKIRFSFTVGAFFLVIISMFLRYQKRKKAKCILLISGIGISILLSATANIAYINSANAFLILLSLGQLAIPILYLKSSGDDPDGILSKEQERDEAIAMLNKLDQDLRDGYITDSDYDYYRQQYIDKL